MKEELLLLLSDMKRCKQKMSSLDDYIIIIQGGEIDNKHHFFVIDADADFKEPKAEVDSLENLKNLIRLYENNIENFKYEDEGKNEEEIKREFNDYKKRIEELEENKIDAIPVFYKTVKNNNKKFIYLSPSCITREVYYNTIEKILENMGDYNPCDNVTKLCDACSLFGMVAQNGANSSRLRFTDGKYESNDNGIYDDVVTLSELAAPKINKTLCKTTENDLTLPYYKEIYNSKKSKHQ